MSAGPDPRMDFNAFSTLVTFVTACCLVTGGALTYALWLRHRLNVAKRRNRAVAKDYEQCRSKLASAENRLLALEQNSREYEQVVHEMMRTL
jgi:uncharacterized membrane protein YciS (DUF1049 family)